MSHDEIQELLGAFALDAVDPEEAIEVEAHLPTCARCRAEVAEHREVAGLLAHTGNDAPQALWDRIAASLDAPQPPMRLAAAPRPPDGATAGGPMVPPTPDSLVGSDPTVPGPAPSAAPGGRSADGVVVPLRRRTRMLPALAGAVAAALVAILGVQVVEQGRRIDEMEQTASRDPARRAYDLALADADSRVVDLTGDDGTVVKAVLTDEGEGWLDASQLAALDRSQTYQLWGDAGEVLVSLGVLGSDPEVVHFDARGYEALAVTAERSPGVVVSEQPPVVAGTVTA